jgi:hypothetical protein
VNTYEHKLLNHKNNSQDDIFNMSKTRHPLYETSKWQLNDGNIFEQLDKAKNINIENDADYLQRHIAGQAFMLNVTEKQLKRREKIGVFVGHRGKNNKHDDDCF